MSSYKPFCFFSPIKPVAPTVKFDSSLVRDNRVDGSPWNIFQTALETWEFLRDEYGGGTPTSLVVIWYPGFNPLFADGLSYYYTGRVNLNGTLETGDQWNDSVIAHEIGHWVMDKYAKFPPNYRQKHGDCNEGNIGMQYSEGWANFFMAASRSKARSFVDRTYSSRYIDAPDNRPTYIGTKPDSFVFQEDVETSTTFDSTLSSNDSFRVGNSCEWQIAGALLDIYDSNNDGQDRVQRSFKDIYTAFRTKYNTFYPNSINQWWYGWMNTTANRSGGSLGDEQKLLDIFAEHKIQIGIRLKVQYDLGDINNFIYVEPALWLPVDHPYFLWVRGGSATALPFATIDEPLLGVPVRFTQITSLFKGTYYFAAEDYGGASMFPRRFRPTNAQVVIYDGSKRETTTITAPTTRPEGTPWWCVITIEGATSSISVKNKIGMCEIPSPPYDPCPECGT